MIDEEAVVLVVEDYFFDCLGEAGGFSGAVFGVGGWELVVAGFFVFRLIEF